MQRDSTFIPFPLIFSSSDDVSPWLLILLIMFSSRWEVARKDYASNKPREKVTKK